MTSEADKVGASVRARLLNRARERGDDFQLLLTRYANERLLYRLAESPHAAHFVLKGAVLFTLWTGAPHRATRDIDLLGFGDPSEAHLRGVFAQVLTLDVEDDGLRFDIDSMQVGPIREDRAYGGVRVVVTALLTTAKVRLQIDIGFGDAITPDAIMVDFPVLLDFPAPRLRAYPRETAVAEKVEAMITLGQANSRMKDFYDLVILSRTFAFEGDLLARAIQATFQRRDTAFSSDEAVAFTPDFTADPAKNTQWNAFVRKSGVESIGDLAAVMAEVASFVAGPIRAARESRSFTGHWPAGGPWA